MKTIFCLFFLFAGIAFARPKCVQVYYDRVPGVVPDYLFGRTHAIFLQNLLGHFPHIQQYIIPIERYERGQLERCVSSIYLGTYFENRIPDAFLEDFVVTRKNVIWAGYSVWKLGAENLRKLWQVKFVGLSKLDEKNHDRKGRPGFFKYFDYKDETFVKYGEFDAIEKERFVAAHEISIFKPLDSQPDHFIVSMARHSTSGEEVPYVLRNRNHWYVGDSPFPFMHEEDRYLIFADLLFDILEESPRYTGKKPALIRLEDVHPKVPLWQLYRMANLMHAHKVPFSISIIPIFKDPLMVMIDDPAEKFVPLTNNRPFMEFLTYAAERNASYIYHGVTHQYGEGKNPFNGLTGDDFEFWNRVENAPVKEDSAEFAVRRIEDGLTLLEQAKVKTVAWLTPHYQASALDYTIFGQLFFWNVGRIIYFPHEVAQKSKLPFHLNINTAGASGNGKRLSYFSDLAVKLPKGLLPAGQFYPYEIFGDIYGQRIVPENVGNVQPYMNEQVYMTQTVDDLIRILKRNRVLRDNWGSFFLHPFRLGDRSQEGVGSFPGETKEIERLIIEARKAGYEFIDLKTWVRDRLTTTRLEPIEVK